jgi:peptide deformylase
MTVSQLRQLPEKILQQKPKKVPCIDGSTHRLIKDMIETMQQAGGVGLAAPQIGVSLRVIVLQMPGEEPVAIINPAMVKRSGEREVAEGCLSVPGYQGEIKRSNSVVVKGLNEQGKPVRIKADGLMAQALEHELDHLNGVLYLAHIESQDKLYQLEPRTNENETD